MVTATPRPNGCVIKGISSAARNFNPSGQKKTNPVLHLLTSNHRSFPCSTVGTPPGTLGRPSGERRKLIEMIPKSTSKFGVAKKITKQFTQAAGQKWTQERPRLHSHGWRVGTILTRQPHRMYMPFPSARPPAQSHRPQIQREKKSSGITRFLLAVFGEMTSKHDSLLKWNNQPNLNDYFACQAGQDKETVTLMYDNDPDYLQELASLV